MNFVGAAKRLDKDVDIAAAAAQMDVEIPALLAVMEVEATGSGFDKKARPKMLFEPHVFYRNLSGAKRTAAVKAKLAYAKWKTGAYPADSYPRLVRAMAIDEEAALRSASWGLGQILGENFKAAGYPSAKAMVEAFREDEEHHLDGMMAFIRYSGLRDELQRKDWAGFARGYNGAGYAKHGYHTKLAKAYERHRKAGTPISAKTGAVLRLGSRGPSVAELQRLLIARGHQVGEAGADGWFGAATDKALRTFQKAAGITVDGVVGDETWGALRVAPALREAKAEYDKVTRPMPKPAQRAPVVAADLYDGKAHVEVERVQARLRDLGYAMVGNVDGKWGNFTRDAILAFRADNAMPLEPTIDEALLVALNRAAPRPVSNARATAEASDIPKSEVVKKTRLLEWLGGVLGVGSIVTGGSVTVDQVMEAGRRISAWRGVADNLVDMWPYVIVAAVGGGVFYLANRAKKAEVQGYREGRHV